MSDFSYDPNDSSTYEWQSVSNELWSSSITLDQIATDEWLYGDPELANQYYHYSDQIQDLSSQAYQESWDAWYGPVNAEGYTAYDASIGYTSTDTSFIEPASSAGSMSMISDYSAESTL
ncbi:MAG: hypothetical protein Q7V88_07420 [Actinomycetota bacterium]|nr:hypothetical protein [Actinomycetota bacterium]